MSSMVERAAKALRYYANDNATAVQMARDALLAAHNPEDEALASLAYDAASDALVSVKPVGRSIIEALRNATIAQGENRP